MTMQLIQSEATEPAPSPRMEQAGAPPPRPGLRQRVQRHLQRMSQRQRVGQAYDMAREVARYLPRGAILDVGCGNGFIAHHLSALIETSVSGVDITAETEAPIQYEQFDGLTLPHGEASFHGALVSYVLHHCGDPASLLGELRRVLAPSGRVVIYEDVPATWFDHLLCLRHDLAWRSRSGACTFLAPGVWRGVFRATGFDVLRQRLLSRLRDPGHPVLKVMFVLERR